jgi:CRP-like cAMP-binding protein|eukprot:COSAG01_NODE_2928_length_6838_cov_168.682149_5_plen_62_part_00
MKGAGSPAERVLNVMGDRACFGDWGVVNDQRRFASLKTVSDTELLVINAHNVRATTMQIHA